MSARLAPPPYVGTRARRRYAFHARWSLDDPFGDRTRRFARHCHIATNPSAVLWMTMASTGAMPSTAATVGAASTGGARSGSTKTLLIDHSRFTVIPPSTTITWPVE